MNVATGKSWPVRVSEHALEQAAERAGVNDKAGIAEQVAAALEAGRVSADRPTWLDPRNHSSSSGLYCWTDDGTVYVLVAGDDHFLVVTTLTASEEAAA
jgi:hypothetical protein